MMNALTKRTKTVIMFTNKNEEILDPWNKTNCKNIVLRKKPDITNQILYYFVHMKYKWKGKVMDRKQINGPLGGGWELRVNVHKRSQWWIFYNWFMMMAAQLVSKKKKMNCTLGKVNYTSVKDIMYSPSLTKEH